MALPARLGEVTVTSRLSYPFVSETFA